MTRWLNLSNEERRNTIAIVAEATGLPVNAVEKDWWVTLTLRAIFSTSHRFLKFPDFMYRRFLWRSKNVLRDNIDQ